MAYMRITVLGCSGSVSGPDSPASGYLLEEEETAEHILCACPAITLQRLRHMGKRTLSPREVKEVAFRRIVNFIKEVEDEFA